MENQNKTLTKAEKKAAKRSALEKAVLQSRRDTLSRELTLDAETLAKLRKIWSNILIENKIPEMQNNLRYVLHYMEKLVEAENFRQMQFEDERTEMEEKVALLNRSHVSASDMLFGIYQKRVADMQLAFDSRVSRKQKDAEKEFRRLENKEKEAQDNMQTMLFQMQLNKDSKEYSINCNIFLKLDDERSKNTEVQESLKWKMQKKMEKKWGEIKSTLAKYEELTRERKREYLQLKAKDDADSKTIYLQMKKTQQLLDQLEELKSSLEDFYAPEKTISLIADLKEERELFVNTFKALKGIVEDELDDDEEALKNLTHISVRITKYLRELVKKGENILKLYRICLKYETQKEKVNTVSENFGIMKELTRTVVHIPKDIYKKIRNPQDSRNMQNISAEQRSKLKEFDILNKFWKKMGRAHLSKLALTKYIHNLQKENAFFKKCLANYMREYAEKKTGLSSL